MSKGMIGTVEQRSNGSRIESAVTLAGRTHQAYFQCEGPRLSASVEAMLAVTLLPAMKAGVSEISVAGGAESQFIANLARIQEIIISWKPNYKRVAFVGLGELPPQPSPAQRTGLFFSGGIDSFYTLLTSLDEVDDIVFIHGFDSPLTDQSHYQRVQDNLVQITEHYGKGLVVVENNIRSAFNRYIPWGMLHGAAMGAVCQVLYPAYDRYVFPSSHAVVPYVPWGSHPDLDPLWAGSRFKIIHRGLVDRLDKVRLVAESDFALSHLRVCFDRPRVGLNCGRCEKCLRTMINLRVLGFLERYPLFQAPLDLRKVARLHITPANYEFFEENLNLLEEKNTDQDLATALRTALANCSPVKKRSRWLARFASLFSRRGNW